MTDGHITPAPSREAPGWVLVAGAIMIAAVVLLLCLVPEENRDFFWQVRTGSDILLTGRAPHADTYSWPCAGTPWYVPEWLMFALFALAFKAGAFFGTWMVKVVLALAFAMVVWFSLARRTRPLCALILTIAILMAMRLFIQERPYMVTYLLLAISLVIIESAREQRIQRMLWLPLIAVPWANLHQGVLVLPSILMAFAIGDGVYALWLRIQRRGAFTPLPQPLSPAGKDGQGEPASHGVASGEGRAETSSAPTISRESGIELAGALPVSEPPSALGEPADYARRALITAGTAVACCLTSMVSPYGPGLYENVYLIVNDPTVMKMVIEWSAVTAFPVTTFPGYYVLIVIIALGYLGTREPRDLGGLFAILGMFAESLLHVRNVPLFAITGTFIAARHVESTARTVSRWLGDRLRWRVPRVASLTVAAGLACLFLVVLANQCLAMLKQEIGPAGYSPEGIGEAVIGLDWFPIKACQFISSEQFPPNLRLYNDFGIGGYLIYVLPNEPVFMDGRNDVYSEQILRDYLDIRDLARPDRQNAAITHYALDCVITSKNTLAANFAERPDWALVYADSPSDYPRYFVLLRSRPEYADLITRCQRDCPALQNVR
jgi:hypothetical protein